MRHFYPSYFVAQKASVASKIFTAKQKIHNNGLASGSSPITRAKGVRAVMPQSFRPFNMEEEHTLLAKGEEISTP